MHAKKIHDLKVKFQKELDKIWSVVQSLNIRKVPTIPHVDNAAAEKVNNLQKLVTTLRKPEIKNSP